jgi:hypothetical protein
MVSQYSISLECLVLPKISGEIPQSPIDTVTWNIPVGIPLADPEFNRPGRIDLLIGAEIFFNILKPGRQVREGPYPVLQESEFGWILAGGYDSQHHGDTRHRPLETFVVTDCGNLDDQLRRFWEIEEWSRLPTSKEERECEEHFQGNTKRDQTGRFIVRLPFKQNPSRLGESKGVAVSRLHHLERRLRRNDKGRIEYATFLSEYEALGHMQEVDDAMENNDSSCYLPHHHVVKESSSTTKTRVVFDASAKTTNGLALNDILMVGPTLQEDIQAIILRFRTHQIAFTADIEKMYRQIRVDERDCRFQRILWRKPNEQQIKTFELQTVTYGTASAPFLATRCLLQLAREESHNYPKAAEILSRDFYVDDCISGCKNAEEALSIQNELQCLLKAGGFELRKWCSNDTGLLNSIAPERRESQLPLQLDRGEHVRTLGLLWDPGKDIFQIHRGFRETRESKFHRFPTKRQVLAIIASIFDPLGLIGPIVVQGKIFLQQLWLAKLDWDQCLPTNILPQWHNWYENLQHIDRITIDRLVTIKGVLSDVQLHGFSDASEKAYGA